MAEYIDRHELIKSIVNTPLSWDYPVTPEHLTGSAKRQNEILSLIDDMPAADVRENVKGKMTNREWLESLSNEDLAAWLCDAYIVEAHDPLHPEATVRYQTGLTAVIKNSTYSILHLQDWFKDDHNGDAERKTQNEV